jgi:hypothetical protein
MNERIKELAAEARLLTGWTVGEVEYQRFAELIIQRCINQVKEQYVPVLEDTEMMKDTHWDGYVQCGVDSVVGIREHFFGVEE